MGESARSIAKKAGGDAVQRTVEALLPRLFERLDHIEQHIAQVRREVNDRVSAVDRELHGLREHMDSRFEQLRDEMNELGLRVVRMEGRMEEVVRVIGQQNDRVNRQSDKMDQWIERLVRLEMAPASRRGKRAS